MNKQDWVECLLFSGLKILATTCVLIGLLGLFFELVETWDRFDPNYLGAFLAATVLRPLLVLLAGVFLSLISGKLARRAAARFARS